jgi:hypothetical protein
MKYIKYVWFAVVAFSVLGLLAIVGPKVYDQIQYQFFDPDGDSLGTADSRQVQIHGITSPREVK